MIVAVLFFVVLMGCVALAIDGARLYAEGLRVQKAADEAALATVTHVGGGIDSGTLTNLVNGMVSRNLPLSSGAASNASYSVSGGATSATSQLKIVVQETGFPLFFAPILGLKSATITREATAQYNAPVPMGNPTNTLGDPGTSDGKITVYQPNGSGTKDHGTATTVPQNMKLSINGPDTLTENGDPYAPLYVLSDPPFASNTSISNPFPAQASPAYNGYDYKVTINSSGYTYIQVFDAETCNGSFNDLIYGAGFGVPYPSNITSYFSNLNFATFYSLYKYNSATNARVGVDNTNPGVVTLGRDAALDTAVYNYPIIIAPTEGTDPSSCYSSSALAQYTNRWYTLAKIKGAPGDTYIVNVSTCLNASTRGKAGDSVDQYTNTNSAAPPACYGSELNNFALRAITSSTDNGCIGPSSGSSCQSSSSFATGVLSQPTLAGMGRVSVEVNDPGASGKTFIYLAHVDQVYKGKWLLVKLFDPGDVQDASSIQIVRPDGTYAPFMWYTETLDGNGKTFTTPMQGNVIDPLTGDLANKSLITSFANGGECSSTTYASCSSPTYSSPTSKGQCNASTPDPTGPGAAAPAIGQTLAQDNPFDPAQLLCLGTTPKMWDSPSSAFPSDTSYGGGNDGNSTHYYDYNYSTIGGENHYQPFNGRWVYMFTQIPANYDDGVS